jgi:hypothetical protein
MYEKEIRNMPINEESCSTGFNFPEFQTKKRVLAEEGLKVSSHILDCLLGARPQETKEAPVINSFMTDLESEYDTIKELYDNLVRIATLLGRI